MQPIIVGFDKSLPPVRFLEDRSISGKLRGLVCLLLNGMNACMRLDHNACFFETQHLRTCLSFTHMFCFPLQNKWQHFVKQKQVVHFLPNSQAVYQYLISISLRSQKKCLPDSLLFPLFLLVLAESIATTMIHTSNHYLKQPSWFYVSSLCAGCQRPESNWLSWEIPICIQINQSFSSITPFTLLSINIHIIRKQKKFSLLASFSLTFLLPALLWSFMKTA